MQLPFSALKIPTNSHTQRWIHKLKRVHIKLWTPPTLTITVFVTTSEGSTAKTFAFPLRAPSSSSAMGAMLKPYTSCRGSQRKRIRKKINCAVSQSKPRTPHIHQAQVVLHWSVLFYCLRSFPLFLFFCIGGLGLQNKWSYIYTKEKLCRQSNCRVLCSLLQKYSSSWRRVQPNFSWNCRAAACAVKTIFFTPGL